MIITCPSCQSRFAVKAESIGFSGRMVRCAKCKHSWFQDPPEESVLAAEKMAQAQQETQASIQDSENSNVPAIITNNNTTSLYIKISFAASCLVFLFALSIVGSDKILPYMSWYYGAMGIHDDAGISLSNVSVQNIVEGTKKELLVKGRIVNDSKSDKAIPDLRIILLSEGRKTIRAVVLNSHDAALAPGEGVDFENSIANPPEKTASVVMEIGNPLNLAAR